MAIDFEVEPEFQEKLDWIDGFIREEIEPLDLYFRDTVSPFDKSNKTAQALVQPLQAVSYTHLTLPTSDLV